MDNLHKVASAHTLAAREPILKYIKFQSSPTQIRVSRLYGKVGIVSYPDNHQFCKRAKAHDLTFSPSKSSSVQEHMLKHFNRMTHHSKVFIIHFHQVIPSKVDQVLCLALASMRGMNYNDGG